MKLGFIGCGNMAGAIIRGVLASGLADAEEILASARTEKTLSSAREAYGIRTTLDNTEVAAFADVLILAVKPAFLSDVIEEIQAVVKQETVVVSLAAGRSLAAIESAFGRAMRLVRVMPNTPAAVGEGMTALCANESVTDAEREAVLSLFSSFGEAEFVSEHLFDAVTAVSGSGPAYVFLFIEALSDAGVAEGMTRDAATRFAAQTVLGSAKMVLETGMSPAALKDMVCSPGGTTIEAVRVLEAKGLRSAIIEAAKACAEKSRNL